MMDNRYSQNARRAVKLATYLAHNYKQSVVDTAHLFAGILQMEDSLGHQILEELSITTSRVEQALLMIYPEQRSENASGQSTYTPALDNALNLALKESRTLGHHYLGTEHMLLGLIRQSDKNIDHLLQHLQVSSEQIRGRTLRLLRSGVSEITMEAASRMARLSELGRRVLNATRQLAASYNQHSATPYHLLMVLARERRSIAYRLLPACNFDVTRLEILLPSLPEISPEGEARLDHLLDRAVDRAEAFGSHYTGTEHILLAMTLNLEGQTLLLECNIDLDCLQHRLHEILSG